MPLAFVLLSERRTKDYRAVLSSKAALASKKNNKDSQEPTQLPLKIQKIVVDLEKAVWNAAQSTFQNVKVMGCAFHWSQCIFKRLKKLGLGPTYKRDGEKRIIIRKLMSLYFLLSDKIKAAFYNIRGTVECDLMVKFCEYIETNWIFSTVWPPTA